MSIWVGRIYTSKVSIDQLRAAAKALDVSSGLILTMVEAAEHDVKIRGVGVKTTWSKKSEATMACVAVGSVAPLLLFGSVLGTLIGTVLGTYFSGALESNKDEQEKSG